MNKEYAHLIDWKYWSDESIRRLLELAMKIKRNRWAYQGRLMGRSFALIFQKTSTRTRISFESGINELGGNSIYMDWNTSNFAISDIRHEVKYLSRNVSGIVARMKSNSDLMKMAEVATVPLINGCCDLYHPCQVLADCLTIKQYRPDMAGTKLTYVGIYNNVVNSLVSIAPVFGIRLTLVCPEDVRNVVDEESRKKALDAGLLTETSDIKTAVDNADFVYTDTWVDMEYFGNPDFADRNNALIKKMMPYQINAALMKDSNAYIMHDMPIHSDYEITDEMVNDGRSIIFEQAENRLDSQKAILVTLINSFTDRL